MSKPPTVSVIIPTHNRAHMVGRAIQSVMNQTFDDWELLVIDDGSTDDTEEVVRRFADSRIRYVHHEANSGPAAARNTGIRASRGEYVAFLDSDDEFLPDKLDRQLRLFLGDGAGDLGVVACDFVKIIEPAGELVMAFKRPLRGWVYDDLLERRSKGYGTSLIMVKKGPTAAELFFDESLVASEDFELLIRLAAICRFDYVAEPLVRRHLHSGPHVHVGANVIRGQEQFLEKYAIELRQRPKVLRDYHLWLARAYWEQGDRANARRHIAKARQASVWIQAPYFWLLSAASGSMIFVKVLKARDFSYLRRRLRAILSSAQV